MVDHVLFNKTKINWSLELDKKYLHESTFNNQPVNFQQQNKSYKIIWNG